MSLNIDETQIDADEFTLKQTSGGDVYLQHDSSGARLEWDDSAGSWTLGGDDLDNVGALTTEEVDVTGETFIVATRENINAGISSGTWTNAVDAEQEDSRDEMNASQQFVPDKSGWYDFSGVISIDNGASGDLCEGRIQNVDDGEQVGTDLFTHGVGDTRNFQFPFATTVELTAGKAYEVQGTDDTSSFDMEANQSYLVIKRSVVHP